MLPTKRGGYNRRRDWFETDVSDLFSSGMADKNTLGDREGGGSPS